MLTRRHRPRDEHGTVAILVVMMSTVLFVVAALVVDLGLARDTRRQAQNAVDASALAAANVLFPPSATCRPPALGTPPCFGDAIAEAKSYAQTNYGVEAAEWTGCSDPASLSHTPDSDCISFDDPTSPSRVRVLVPRRNVETGLGTLAGVSSVPVAASAEASVQTTALLAGAIFAIANSCGDKTLEINGGDIAFIGNVHSNGHGKLNGDILIDGNLHTVGPANLNGDVDVTGAQTTGPPVRADPLAEAGEDIALWRPGTPKAVALAATGDYHDLGGTRVTTQILQARGDGVYYTTNGVTLGPNTTMNNVTFVIDKSVDEKAFDANGTNISLSPYVDPLLNPNEIQVITNAAGSSLGSSAQCDKVVVHVNGNNFKYKGAIYAPNGYVHLNGNNHTSDDGSIVAYTIKINGNGASVANDEDDSIGDADISLSR